MIEVSKGVFYKVVGGPRNVHPRPEPDHCVWVDQQSHEIVGLSQPGYLAQGNPKYLLLDSLCPQGEGRQC